MHRYGLRDDQWERIKNFLPGRKGHVGGTAEQPAFRGGRPLSLSGGHPLARPSGAVRRLEEHAQALAKMVRERRLRADLKTLAEDRNNEHMMIDANALIGTLEERGITPVIPPKANQTVQRHTDFDLYRERNLVERYFGNLIRTARISSSAPRIWL